MRILDRVYGRNSKYITDILISTRPTSQTTQQGDRTIWIYVACLGFQILLSSLLQGH